VLIKVRRNHLTTTWHLGGPYPINRHIIGLVFMGGLVLFLLKRRQRGDKSGEIQSVRKEDEKVGTVDGKFVPHGTNRPANTELSEWVGRSA
jgi:hypothetical protein